MKRTISFVLCLLLVLTSMSMAVYGVDGDSAVAQTQPIIEELATVTEATPMGRRWNIR